MSPSTVVSVWPSPPIVYPTVIEPEKPEPKVIEKVEKVKKVEEEPEEIPVEKQIKKIIEEPEPVEKITEKVIVKPNHDNRDLYK